jgi:hypothetical protein
MANGFASMSRVRAENKHAPGKRRRLDDYETPEGVTRALLDTVEFKGPVFEPAAGSGRMARVIAAYGHKVTTADIKRGKDFLQRQAIIPANVITNPPYKDGLAEQFCRKALNLADGKVAMLVQAGFVYGDKRATGLFHDFVPAVFIHIPERILFINGGTGKPIKSQFYNHLWVVWNERGARARVRNGDTRTFIVSCRESEFN